MIDEKVKLEEYFKDEINRVSEIEIDKIDNEIAKIKEQSIESLDAEAKQEAQTLRELELRELQSDHAIALSRTHEGTNRKLMAKREELTKLIFAEARTKLEAFAQSTDYLPYIQKKAEDVASYGFQDVVFFVAKQDEDIMKDIIKAYGLPCSVQIDETITLGGFRMECESAGVDMDETFDTNIEEQKEWFYTNSGLFIK